MPDSPKINGKIRSSSSVAIMLDGQKYTGVQNIQYKHYTRDMVHNYGFGENPYGISFGNITMGDCSITMLRDSAVAFLSQLLGKSDKAETLFNVDIMFKDTPKSPAQHDMLENCALKDSDQAIAQAEAAALAITLIVLPMRSRMNGLKFEKESV